MNARAPTKKSPARRRTRQQLQGCTLLQLPIELVLLIAGSLAKQNQMILAQTCRALWRILHECLRLDLRLGGRYMRLPCDAHLDYLVCLARGKPNTWLCDSCRGLHPVTHSQIERSDVSCVGWKAKAIHLPGPTLYYHHVQLALKYSRMKRENPTYRRSLKKLLAPQHTEPLFPEILPARQRFSASHRIVDGKFLLHTVWVCALISPHFPVSLDNMGPMKACQHLFAPETPLGLDYRSSLSLAQAIELAMDKPEGGEVCGWCPWCATDFSVEASPVRITMRAWNNLGPEGSPLNPEWRAQTDYRVNLKGRVPGAVRKMFGREEPGF